MKYTYIGIQGYNKTNTYKLLLVSCFHIFQAYTILSLIYLTTKQQQQATLYQCKIKPPSNYLKGPPKYDQ